MLRGFVFGRVILLIFAISQSTSSSALRPDRPLPRAIASLPDAFEFANKLSSITSPSPSDSYRLTQTIRVLGQHKQLGTALSLVQSAVKAKIPLNSHHFVALLQACRLNRQWDIAESLFDRMNRYGVGYSTLHCNIMIAIHSEADRVDSILSTLQFMENRSIPFDAFTLSSAINGCIKGKDLNRALAISEVALQSEFANNTFVFNAVLRSFSESRQWERLLALFCQAVDKRLPLDSVTYSIVISALGETLQFELAQTVFESMSNASTRAVLRDNGVYNSMIVACERSKRWKEAVDYLRRMEHEGLKPDCKTLCSTITCCGNARQWKVIYVVIYISVIIV